MSWKSSSGCLGTTEISTSEDVGESSTLSLVLEDEGESSIDEIALGMAHSSPKAEASCSGLGPDLCWEIRESI